MSRTPQKKASSPKSNGHSAANKKTKATRGRELIEDEFYELEFSLRRSLRYLQKRKSIFETTHIFCTFISLFAGSAALGAVISKEHVIGIAIGLGASAVYCADTAIGFSKRAERYDNLHKRFTDLCVKMKSETPSLTLISLIRDERDAIQRDEPSIYRALDVLCHNQEAIARGIKDKNQLYYINKWQLFCKHIWTFEGWIPKTLLELNL